MGETAPTIFHKWQTIVLVICAILALVLPDSDPEKSYWKGPNSDAHHVEINAVLIILTALVTISLTFEYLHHHLHHSTTDIFLPVLKALNGELMGLGFLAIIFYLIEVRFQTLSTWSTNTICVECDPCAGFPTPYHADGTRRLLEDTLVDGRRLAGAAPVGVGCNFDLCQASYNASKGLPVTQRNDYITLTSGNYSVEHTHYAKNDSARPTVCDQYHVKAKRFLLEYEHSAPGFIEGVGGLPSTHHNPTANQEYYDILMQLPVGARHQAIHGEDQFEAHRKLGGGMTGECWHCDEILLHLFEDVHMTLFLVMVLYFIRSVLLIQQTEWQATKWRKFETELKTTEKGEERVLQKYYDTMKSGTYFGKLKAREKMEYVLLRKRFLKTGSQSGALEEANFNFAEYLAIVLGHSAAHMVHIPPKAWAILELVFILFWACMQAPTETRIRGFQLIALGLMGIMSMFFGKLYSIRDQLLLKIPASPYQCPPIAELDKVSASPMYLKNKMKTSGNGHITNQQEVCFWWGSKGPAFIMHVVRLLNMNMLIYFVLLGFAIPYTAKNDDQFLIPLVALVPFMILASFFGPIELLRMYSIVSNVELLKDPHAIEHTIRIVKLARSIRTIKLLRSLQSVVKQKKMVDGLKDKGATEDPTTKVELTVDFETMDDAERAKADQLQEVFNLFDSSGDGSVDIGELGGLMSALGVELTEDDRTLLMKEFDRSGDGNISFAEFFSYMQSRSTEVDTHQLVHDVFEMIDKDGSGSITVEEFQSVLMKLPVQISEADIDVIVREIDSGGDGEISLHEFADVLEKFK